MPAQIAPIYVEAGSFEPMFWTFTDPDTREPIDLTAAGFEVDGVVATRDDGAGRVLLRFTDVEFRRTADGRVYFEPRSATTSGWAWIDGFYQFELHHPAGEAVRFAAGPFQVSPELAPD